jgi:hypothetical protein
MPSKCFHCGKGFEGDKKVGEIIEKITIVRRRFKHNGRNWSNDGEGYLDFHGECYEELAGQKYTPEIYDEDGRFSAEESDSSLRERIRQAFNLPMNFMQGSKSLSTAEGVELDKIGAILGVKRNKV